MTELAAAKQAIEARRETFAGMGVTFEYRTDEPPGRLRVTFCHQRANLAVDLWVGADSDAHRVEYTVRVEYTEWRVDQEPNSRFPIPPTGPSIVSETLDLIEADFARALDSN